MANRESFVFVQDVTPLVLPYPKDYAWDFERNRFILDIDGTHIFVYGNEAVKVWIYKALKTTRNKYAAYDSRFGCDFEYLFGQNISDGEKIAEIKRYTKEALLCNPYITDISNITINLAGDNLNIDLSVTTIYGRENISYGGM